MTNHFLLRSKKLKFLLSAFTFLALGLSPSAHPSDWKQRTEKYLKLNFNRARFKTNSYIENKYKVPSTYFQIQNNFREIRRLTDRVFKSCHRSPNQSNCRQFIDKFNEKLLVGSQFIRSSILDNQKKLDSNTIKAESALLNLFTLGQQKANNISEAMQISLDLDASLSNYLQKIIPKKSINHLNDYLIMFENPKININKISKSELNKLTNTINYFIRKEHETTNLKSSERKTLELINLFWNNVLKIKKDQR